MPLYDRSQQISYSLHAFLMCCMAYLLIKYLPINETTNTKLGQTRFISKLYKFLFQIDKLHLFPHNNCNKTQHRNFIKHFVSLNLQMLSFSPFNSNFRPHCFSGSWEHSSGGYKGGAPGVCPPLPQTKIPLISWVFQKIYKIDLY